MADLPWEMEGAVLSKNRSPRPDLVEGLPSVTVSLIARARAHDQDAWRCLLTLYAPLVRAWCQRSGITGQDADDVIQEVFQSVAMALGNFRPHPEQEGCSFRAWLRVITRNKMLDVFRHSAGQPQRGVWDHDRMLEVPEQEIDLVEDDDEPTRVRYRARYERAVERVRSEFGDRTWQAFSRATVDGHAPADIARDLGISADSVRQAKSRVLRRLKSVMAETTP